MLTEVFGIVAGFTLKHGYRSLITPGQGLAPALDVYGFHEPEGLCARQTGYTGQEWHRVGL